MPINEDYYYAGGKKIKLNRLADSIAVRYKEVPSRAMVRKLSEKAAFADAEERKEMPKHRMVIVTLPASRRLADVEDSVKDLENDPQIDSVFPVFREARSGLRMIASDEITIRFKSDAPREEIENFHKENGVEVIEQNRFMSDQYLLRVKNPKNTLSVANKFQESGWTEFAEPNFIAEAKKAALPNDVLINEQWHLHNTGQGGGIIGEDVSASEAWDITTGSPDIVIAIIDDGVDIDHPDLKANIWENPNPDSAMNDVNGWNFYDNNNDPRPRKFTPPYSVLAGNDRHGTLCAGVAASVGGNATGVTGIAYKCKILPVKIFIGDDLVSFNIIADAIRYAGQRADVLSNSWSIPPSSDVESAIKDVVRTGRGGKGTPVFVATGNGDANRNGLPYIGFPASVPEAIAVGASTNRGVRASYSNYGEGLDFVAPSSGGTKGIFTTDVSIKGRGFNAGDISQGGADGLYTNSFGGTSSATSLAAGVAALILSFNPELTWDQVRSIMRETADKIDPANASYVDGYSLEYGYGRINAYKALQKSEAQQASLSLIDESNMQPPMPQIPEFMRKKEKFQSTAPPLWDEWRKIPESPQAKPKKAKTTKMKKAAEPHENEQETIMRDLPKEVFEIETQAAGRDIYNVSSDLHLSHAEEIAKDLVEDQKATPPRYADFTFFYDEGAEVPKGHFLQQGREYQLEVAVRLREKIKGIKFKGAERKPIDEPGQKENVDIIVTAEPEDETVIEIREPVQILILPPLGDSTENAVFHVKPLRQSSSKENIAQIRIRLYYEFNLIEVARIDAEVVGRHDDPARSLLGKKEIDFIQERRELGYEHFDSIMPRDMHIDINKKGENFVFTFACYKSPDQKIVMTAPATLTAIDLDTDLKEIREIWYKIAMSERFTGHLEGDSSYNNMVRGLAMCGSKLWTGLFMRDPKSSIFKIGEWLKDHPVNTGGLIQVSIKADAANFVFPWALLYDKELKDNELPDINGFWGMRYCIEQHLPGITKTIDKPYQVADKLKIGFMLVDTFSNESQERSMMDKLKERGSDKLDITPPITDNDDCYNLLARCDAHILYFYTHGYTKYKKEIGAGNDMEIFKMLYDGVDKNSPLYERLRSLNDRIKREQNDFKPKDSWIELTNGRLYLADLYRRITSGFDTSPLVILNMCESAQIIPSLSDSFIHFFIVRGAKSVIGTECPMTVEFAHPFAEKFLEGILKGEQIGTVLLDARRHFITKLNNPLGLAYTLFGSATARFEPAILQ